MKKDLKADFELACQKLIRDPEYDRTKYLHLVHDKIQLVTLIKGLKPIAMKYIPHTKTKFPAELIVKISAIMNVYVTDLTSLGRKNNKNM